MGAEYFVSSRGFLSPSPSSPPTVLLRSKLTEVRNAMQHLSSNSFDTMRWGKKKSDSKGETRFWKKERGGGEGVVGERRCHFKETFSKIIVIIIMIIIEE